MAGALVLVFVLFNEALCSYNFNYIDDSDYNVPAVNNQLYYLNPTSQDPQDVLLNVNDNNNRYPSASVDNGDALERLIYALTSLEIENNGRQTSPALTSKQDMIPPLLLPITLPTVSVPSYERFPYKRSYLSNPLTTTLPPTTTSIGVPISSSNSYFTLPFFVPSSSISCLISPETYVTSKSTTLSSPLTNVVPSVLNVESKLPSSSSESDISLLSLLASNSYGAEDVSYKGSVPASGSFRVKAQFSPDGNVNNCDQTNRATSKLLHTTSVCSSTYNFNNGGPNTYYPVNNVPDIPDNIYRQSLRNQHNLNNAINVDNVYNSPINAYTINHLSTPNENGINSGPCAVISDNNYSREESVYSNNIPITDDLICHGHNIDSSAMNNAIATDYVAYSGTVRAKGKFTVAAHF